jgi:hypothetical protein
MWLLATKYNSLQYYGQSPYDAYLRLQTLSSQVTRVLIATLQQRNPIQSPLRLIEMQRYKQVYSLATIKTSIAAAMLLLGQLYFLAVLRHLQIRIMSCNLMLH